MKMEQTECSGTCAHKIQTKSNHPRERTQLSTLQWPPSSEPRKFKNTSQMHYTDPADGDKLLQNAGNYLPMDMGSYPIKPCQSLYGRLPATWLMYTSIPQLT